MKRFAILVLLLIALISCKSADTNKNQSGDGLVIAFGSCNKQFVENKLWKEIMKNHPSVWIWGGDNIYSKGEDLNRLKSDYDEQLAQEDYKEIKNRMKILGTWDDHDYGLNDGGTEFEAKAASQDLFLDFMGVDSNDVRRDREGVYHSEVISTEKGSVKVIVLDTRYFRSKLTPSETKGRRYDPNPFGEGTILGKTQWRWLKQELNNSEADFNLIVSSIQVISSEHGFETWGTMPHQRENLFNMIKNSKANNVMILSGDRHISEFSKVALDGLVYPLIDFTSSGLTHSYSNFSGEPNQHREGRVVSEISFGILKFNFKDKKVTMQMRGEGNALQQELLQSY
ncbi:MAG: alkaline phosphatase family protein [Flavobacteriaceae bacterium]|nr:alkaline phosphatase family protein [Flavobacteriaceae bacterium]